MSSASIYPFATIGWIHVNVYLKKFKFVKKKFVEKKKKLKKYKKLTNQPKISDPLLKTSALHDTLK